MNQSANSISKLKTKKRKILKVDIIKHETIWAIQKQAEIILKLFLMAEPMFVAKNLDDFWIGVKGLSNMVLLVFCEIFFRKVFNFLEKVNHWLNKGWLRHYWILSKYEFFWIIRPFYDKILGQKGNNPECLSRL